MPLPDYQGLMLPFLRRLADGKEHPVREIAEALAAELKLTDAERGQLVPSGRRQTIFDTRVGWARTYLKKAGLIDYPRRGAYQITPRGVAVLEQRPTAITVKFLDQFPEFVAFRTLRRDRSDSDLSVADSEATTTPEEELGSAYRRLRNVLEAELLDHVKKASPRFFEQLVIDLLVSMGYGGNREDAAQAVGRSGDAGIDGVIKEDQLGLETIYIQAKRWTTEGSVGRPEIQKFAGALQGQRGRKGVFITTAQFSGEADAYARSLDTKIVLIDGPTLARLMVDHNVGVSPMTTYEVKKLDSDYFEE